MNTVMIVDAALVKRAPQAFKDYIAHYFKSQRILGKECFVAVCSTGDYSRNGWAPSHNVDLSVYKEGLDGVDLNDWMRRREGKSIWTIYGTGHSSSSSINMG